MADADVEKAAAPSETRSFEAEVSRLLHMMVHSVYADRDVFLRELISNAADACERLRMLALDKPELLAEDPSFKIVLSADKAKRRLTVEDNGVGMDHDDLVANLGTIARSGTRAFLASAGEDGSALIGQFGVGFYSAFMVAERVEVFSTPAGKPDQSWRWASDGQGTFTIEPAEEGSAPKRGTRVVLHLAENAADYGEQEKLERVVAAYSSHVPVPIVLRLAEGTEKQLADGSALWRKPRSEIKPEEYRDFYGHVSGQYDESALTLHYRAEGRTEYSVLLFVPSAKPFDLFDPDRKGRVKLYVRRVFITDEAEILPAWLRFVRGVIDSEDLPLNISRETLQKNPILEQIGKAVTGRLLTELEKLAKDDNEKFQKVWEAFGPVIKEGLYEDPERRDALFKAIRFRSTSHPKEWRSLADYVSALRPNQTAIYYALGETEEAILASPQLEGFAQRGVEVLVLPDPVDAFWVRSALGYDGKPFQSVTQGNADISAIPLLEAAGEEAAPDAAVATLAARLKEALGERVSAVRPSTRLAGSPVCLVAADLGFDRQMEKILARHQQGKRSAPVLEINPTHGLIKALSAKLTSGGGKDEIFEDAAVVLLGQARILDGETPEEPADYAARVSRLLMARLG